MSIEIQALLDRTSRNLDHSSWFSYTPVQVLKIEQEKQKAAQEAWLAEFHPSDGAKYPKRSAALYGCTAPAAANASVSRRSSSSRDQQAALLRCSQHKQYSQDPRVYALQHPSNLQEVQQLGAQQTQQEQCVEHGQLQQQQGEQKACSITDIAAAECAEARAAAAAAAAARAAPKPSWWEADSVLASRVRLLLHPSTTVEPGSSSNGSSRRNVSATLGVYDSLLAANFNKAVQLESTGNLDGGTLLRQLQTPEEVHATWVEELSSRSVAERQQQVLVEAVVAEAV